MSIPNFCFGNRRCILKKRELQELGKNLFCLTDKAGRAYDATTAPDADACSATVI
jgi:hypothetical protein